MDEIIVPYYNVENTIERCIKNLTDQSLSKNKYNCYFINDHSNDNTGSILDSYKEFKNVTIIHIKKFRSICYEK